MTNHRYAATRDAVDGAQRALFPDLPPRPEAATARDPTYGDRATDTALVATKPTMTMDTRRHYEGEPT